MVKVLSQAKASPCAAGKKRRHIRDNVSTSGAGPRRAPSAHGATFVSPRSLSASLSRPMRVPKKATPAVGQKPFDTENRRSSAAMPPWPPDQPCRRRFGTGPRNRTRPTAKARINRGRGSDRCSPQLRPCRPCRRCDRQARALRNAAGSALSWRDIPPCGYGRCRRCHPAVA